MRKIDELGVTSVTGVTGVTDLEIVKATSDAIRKSLGVDPEVHMTFDEWMIIQNLLWSECRDLEASLKIYPDKERYHKTHEYVANTTKKLKIIGDKIECYIDKENDHPLWWKRKDPNFYWLKGGEK